MGISILKRNGNLSPTKKREELYASLREKVTHIVLNGAKIAKVYKNTFRVCHIH